MLQRHHRAGVDLHPGAPVPVDVRVVQDRPPPALHEQSRTPAPGDLAPDNGRGSPRLAGDAGAAGVVDAAALEEEDGIWVGGLQARGAFAGLIVVYVAGGELGGMWVWG